MDGVFLTPAFHPLPTRWEVQTSGSHLLQSQDHQEVSPYQEGATKIDSIKVKTRAHCLAALNTGLTGLLYGYFWG